MFGSDAFMPHGHCYFWTPSIVWTQVLSNGAIGLSYVAIAFTLAYVVWRGPTLPFRAMGVAFGTFIITCGLTHFLDVLVIWKPEYWLDSAVRVVTALASMGTALMLPPLVPRMFDLANGAAAARDRGIKLQTMVEELEAAQRRAREIDALKTQFFANVSHELRTPLTLMLGPLERLLAGDGLSEAQRADAELAQRNARSLLGLVNDLLDVAKVEAGKMDLDYARADLATLVRRVSANFEEVARARGVELVVEAPRAMPAELDVARIERVLLNLLANALEFTPSGGRVRCDLRAGGPGAVLEVGDSGPGIPAEARRAVFERFEQAADARGPAGRRLFGGTGLGLAICRDFVTLHGGAIEVGDAPEGGALLRVELPLRAPEGAAVRADAGHSIAADDAARRAVDGLRLPASGAVATGPAEAPLVLVVEDNADMARFVRETLAPDFRTEWAADGAEGLEKTRDLAPDLVLTDMMMPGVSGEALASALRADPALAGIPVVVLSAKADEAMRVRMLRAGVRDYVTKPFFAEELRARVANHVALKRAGDVLRGALATRAHDIEEMARELAKRKAQLEAALDAAQAARELAERASRVKSDFLRLVSHELRTPLGSIYLQIELLGLDPAGEAGQEAIERLRRGAQRLEALVDGLLTYARAERGGLKVEPAAIDVAALVVQIADELRPEAEAKGLALAVEAAPGMPPLRSDAELVALVLRNLVGNATKFTERGGVRVEASHDGAAHRLVVADTGRGIAPDIQPRIFEPFVQGETTRQKHLPGVGLGLALVRQVVEILGGQVHLISIPGEGSTFTVVLPPATHERS